MKFSGIAAPVSKPESTRTGFVQRPDSKILNDAIPLFAIGRNKAGLWVARDCDGPAGNVFWSKGAAVRFARKTHGSEGCALMFVANGLELDQSSSQTARCHNSMKTMIARAVGAIRMQVRKFLSACKESKKIRDLIESELYRNQYRYRSKSDDDLPIVR